jgi:Zn-dependent peptidase ImmA (M78 family)
LIETLANYFAADVLMPNWILVAEYLKTKDVTLLANKFMVPEHSMRFKVESLRLSS